MNLQRREFYPHPWSFDAYSLVMCKQLRSKSCFPIGRSSSPTGGDNLILGGLSVSGLKAEVKAFLEDFSVRIFSSFAQWCYFLPQQPPFLFFSVGFCPAHGTTNPVLVHHRHWRFSIISAFPVMGWNTEKSRGWCLRGSHLQEADHSWIGAEGMRLEFWCLSQQTAGPSPRTLVWPLPMLMNQTRFWIVSSYNRPCRGWFAELRGLQGLCTVPVL